jgi:hypothetical protein
MNLNSSPVGKTAVAVLLAVSWHFAFLQPSDSLAAELSGTDARVAAIEGNARALAESDESPTPLRNGDAVDSWKMISTDAKSKLLLRWGGGLLGSMGEYTSIILTSTQGPGGEIPNISVMEGALRVATDRQAGEMPAAFAVTTPAGLIQAEFTGEPVDFIVEVYEPSKFELTVLSGKVRVKRDMAGGQPEEVVQACRSIYVDKDKAQLEHGAVSPEALRALADQTTIPGTIAVNLEACGPAGAQPIPAREQPPVLPSGYPALPDYYFEDEEIIYDFPYDEIRVYTSPTYAEGVMVFIPGLGEFFLPLAPGLVMDPDVCAFYVRRMFIDYAYRFDRGYHDDILWRIRELNRMVYLAQLSGNYGLLWDAQQQLAYLRIRSDWAARRIHRLDRRLKFFEQEQHRYSGRLPAGVNLHNSIFASFNSSHNRGLVQKFRNRLDVERTVEGRMAGLAGQELVKIRSRAAGERDLRKRLALRHEMAAFRNTMESGKMPIPAKDKEVKDLVTRLAKAGDPGGRVQLQQQVLGQLEKQNQGIKTVNVLTQDKLKNLQQGLQQFPNPQKRHDLEQRAVELEKSVAARDNAAEIRVQQETQIRQMSQQAGDEKDPQKREQLLRQLQQLTVPLTQRREPTAPLPLVQPPQHVAPITPLHPGEKAATDRKLDDQKRQQDLLRQERVRQEQLKQEQALPQQRQREQIRHQEEHDTQADIKRKQAEEARRQLELRRLDDDKKQPVEQQRLDQDRKKQADQQRLEGERHKKDEQQRLEQERHKQVEQQRLDQDRKKQADQQRLEGERHKKDEQQRLEQERHKQVEQQRLDQDRKKQTDIHRQQQLQQEQVREQQLRQERGRQEQLNQERIRQQQMEQQRLQQQRLQQDQNQQRQRQQQMQQQQNLQQEKSRQEQARREQVKQQQMRQEQQRGEQTRQQQLRQQQLQQQQQQQDRVKQQQLPLRRQQEEEQRKRQMTPPGPPVR